MIYLLFIFNFLLFIEFWALTIGLRFNFLLIFIIGPSLFFFYFL
jgi:hypothetical protein